MFNRKRPIVFNFMRLLLLLVIVNSNFKKFRLLDKSTFVCSFIFDSRLWFVTPTRGLIITRKETSNGFWRAFTFTRNL